MKLQKIHVLKQVLDIENVFFYIFGGFYIESQTTRKKSTKNFEKQKIEK